VLYITDNRKIGRLAPNKEKYQTNNNKEKYQS